MAWSWTMQPFPSTVPGWMTTWLPSTTPSPSTAPAPTTANGPSSTPSPIRASSATCRSGRGTLLPPGGVQPVLQRLEHAHDAQAGLAVRARRGVLADGRDEVLALQPQGLAIVDRGAVDVPRAGDVLAVGARALRVALVVDGHLALDVHVVEGRHALGAVHGETPLLVRVQPGQVQMRGQARGEAQEAEDHVLDALAHVGLAAGFDLVGLLLGQV